MVSVWRPDLGVYLLCDAVQTAGVDAGESLRHQLVSNMRRELVQQNLSRVLPLFRQTGLA